MEHPFHPPEIHRAREPAPWGGLLGWNCSFVVSPWTSLRDKHGPHPALNYHHANVERKCCKARAGAWEVKEGAATALGLVAHGVRVHSQRWGQTLPLPSPKQVLTAVKCMEELITQTRS